jgi:eukaryotic-like serine/threonine-protein kinase
MIRIPPNGGPPREIQAAQNAESPRVLPDGSGILFVDTRRGSKLKYYDLAADTAYTILEESSEAQYLPSGYLLYTAPTGGLFAIRFDPKRHAVSGTPVPIASDIQANGGVAPFTVTRNGTLVYRAGVERESRVLRIDQRGTVDSLPLAPALIGYLRFSPDGRKLAITIGSARGANRHTALYDLTLGSMTRFTEEGGGHSPVWSPDGTRLAFTAEGKDSEAEDIFVQPLDKSSKPVRVLRVANDQHGSAWPFDTMLVYSSQSAPQTLGGSATSGGGTAANIGIVNPSSPGVVRDYAKAQWDQTDASISPDGQWAAFTSTESGALTIVVRRFPVAGASGTWKVSSGAGHRPRWSGDGRTIYYQDVDNKTIRKVRVTPGEKFEVGKSEVVATIPDLGTAWDIDRRTGTIVVSQSIMSTRAHIVVMQHWVDQFTRTAPR